MADYRGIDFAQGWRVPEIALLPMKLLVAGADGLLSAGRNCPVSPADWTA